MSLPIGRESMIPKPLVVKPFGGSMAIPQAIAPRSILLPRADYYDDLPSLTMLPRSGFVGTPAGQGISEASLAPQSNSMPCTPHDPFVISVNTSGGQIVTAETENFGSPLFKSAGESPAQTKDKDAPMPAQTIIDKDTIDEDAPMPAQTKDVPTPLMPASDTTISADQQDKGSIRASEIMVPTPLMPASDTTISADQQDKGSIRASEIMISRLAG
jgi:hypothetical protein